MKREEVKKWQRVAKEYLDRAGIVLTPEEEATIEIADLGLDEFEQTGLALVVYVNTERVCAKELVLLPGQTCPQHLHPPVNDEPGKEETFRCRWGEIYLYVPGEPTPNPKARPPAHRAHTYTVWRTRWLRTRGIGSRVAPKGRSCRNSARAARMKTTCSPTKIFAGCP